MDLDTSIEPIVFSLIDDWLDGGRIRQRGPKPKPSASEVLTIEVVGEFLGIDTDQELYNYFRQNYREWFPALDTVHRTTFCRQAANLWGVKEKLWKHLLNRIRFDLEASFVNSFLVEVCRFARAYRCRLLVEESAFGYDEMAKQTFYGLRAHLRVSWPGVICAVSLAPANIHDLHVAEKLLEDAEGWVLGDSNYHSPNLADRLSNRGIETVFAQMLGRYKAKKVWARDRWHLRSRWLRKVLSHTMAVFLCQRAGLSPLRFSELLTS